ncbi:hypothetical protein CkaCkLH20_00949 [Colletotrichum karsti]|uniref:Uncharacterized protein n=1 Tax=Colletotrichum karsti TaxID=1095194 RepID=A0A9P6LQ21_9PEZI|nr:uncharacterized protein CkaCkLH20_00949 [Colletotrichum karsti]KAF9881803.1 hypothetical protein CkaCkLH20_00949 [Colletotrichum karsti]
MLSAEEDCPDAESVSTSVSLSTLLSPLSNVSLIRFADDLEQPSQQTLFQLFTSTTLRQTFYPIEHCVDLPRSPNSDALSFSWLLQDKIFLHTILFSSTAIQDRLLDRPSSRLTHFHLRRTISLLNQSLSQSNSHENEALFHVILILAMISGLWGDYDSTAIHLSGLQQIVRLRGGLDYLGRYPKLHFKLDRLALTWALGSGEVPNFFVGPVSWSPYFGAPLVADGDPLDAKLLGSIVDLRLQGTFSDLKRLVHLVNDHLANGLRLDGLLFQDSLGSIQTRLVKLQNGLEASDECIRLGMLAFLSTTMQIPGGKFPYAYLTDKFRNSCKTFIMRTPARERLMFWLLVVGSISVFEPDEPWLVSILAGLAAPQLSWEEARSRLQDVMWIDGLHEKMGLSAFSELMHRT